MDRPFCVVRSSGVLILQVTPYLIARAARSPHADAHFIMEMASHRAKIDGTKISAVFRCMPKKCASARVGNSGMRTRHVGRGGEFVPGL